MSVTPEELAYLEARRVVLAAKAQLRNAKAQLANVEALVKQRTQAFNDAVAEFRRQFGEGM